jgi:hypothetical protein
VELARCRGDDPALAALAQPDAERAAAAAAGELAEAAGAQEDADEARQADQLGLF